MCKKIRLISVFFLIFAASFFTGCTGGKGAEDSENHTEEHRTTVTDVLVPSPSGSEVYGNDIVSIDASNTSDGYIMISYSGSVEKVKLQITVPDGTIYSYNLRPGNYETFPLSGGNGTYLLTVLENVTDNKYAISFSQELSVTLTDEFKPFLYPNQYVWFTPDSQAVALGVEISENASNDLDYVEQIYRYVIEHITYDDELAANVQSDYLPVIDRTLSSKSGICFDYASLMAALLRSQNIPTKLVVGYSGDAYHAWISVYLKEIGWVNNIIEFDGKNWSLMDPTLAANNSNSSVGKYIGDGRNYIVKYSY